MGWRTRIAHQIEALDCLANAGLITPVEAVDIKSHLEVGLNEQVAEWNDQFEARIQELGMHPDAMDIVTQIMALKWVAEQDERRRAALPREETPEEMIRRFQEMATPEYAVRQATASMAAACRYLGIENGNLKSIAHQVMDR